MNSMAAAAKTWDPAGKYWINGGGGTPWDTITFDPELNMVYIGTGNGSPWNRDLRSPAGGDNLYLASLVALNADTGKYIWHYQENPGDHWDYTSTQPMILADINIDGAPRKVILHAPKNGFFFVVDRTNGKFISAKNFVDVNWATGYDADGRPIEIPEARGAEARDSIPGPFGAHNWHPMSYNPQTGLVYLPAQGVPLNLTPEKTLTQNAATPGKFAAAAGWNVGFVLNGTPPKNPAFGRLLAWDPVKQKEVWRAEYVAPWNGGTLTTAGNLVFQGTADGRFIAYNATSGEKLWETPTGTGVVAAASTFLIDGKQYVSVAVGWGGVFGISQRVTELQSPGTVYTFAIDGKAPLPAFVKYQTEGLLAGVKYDPKDVPEGTAIYVAACAQCHGVPGVDKGGNVKNLGYVSTETIANLKDFVFKGPFRDQGMPDFHRQADGSGCGENPGVHSGHGGRDTSEVVGTIARELTACARKCFRAARGYRCYEGQCGQKNRKCWRANYTAPAIRKFRPIRQRQKHGWCAITRHSARPPQRGARCSANCCRRSATGR